MVGALRRMFRLPRGLSARLLLLTSAFVMVAEVLIYVPSIARFRYDYLEERIALAYLASLALAGPPDNLVSEAVGRELLASAHSYAIVLHEPRARALVLARDMPFDVEGMYDLHEAGPLTLIADAFEALAGTGQRMIQVMGVSPRNPRIMVETIIDEAPMRAEMLAYSRRILALSIIISLITASLVYFSLNWLLVRPMRRMTAAMVAFREDPEKPGRVIVPSARPDEIGAAERELAHMQEGLRAALRERARLAELGAGMARIHHDLRNVLATAQLVSDAVASSADPGVKRVAPTLMGAIDRAIRLCTETLRFAAGAPEKPVPADFALAQLVDELFAELSPAGAGNVALDAAIDPALTVSADRGQLYRVLSNLVRNAIEAGAGRVTVSAEEMAESVAIEVRDDGPGLTARAKERLFQPFAGSARSGGTGLGLAIARELMRGHGGELELASTGPEGTVFRLTLPCRAAAPRRHRAAAEA